MMTSPSRGYSLVELMLVVAVAAAIAATAVPLTSSALDEARLLAAARYLESRIVAIRMHAVGGGTKVALRFEPAGDDFACAEYVDGNGNGVRSAEIASGIDPSVSPPRRLSDEFPGVAFGLPAGIPDLDGARTDEAADGIRLGVSRILTLSPDGSSSSGAVYLRGRQTQYAIRILGGTGRTRVFRFDRRTMAWVER